MTHHIVVSNYMRNKRAEVLVLTEKDARGNEREVMHLHPGTNAVDTDVWTRQLELEPVKSLLASGQLVDKGVAEPEETTAPESPKALAAATSAAPAASSPAAEAAPAEAREAEPAIEHEAITPGADDVPETSADQPKPGRPSPR